jgi:hypothetical protein
MNAIDEILKAADLYAEGLKKVEERKAQWVKKHTELKNHLKTIADVLNNKVAYEQGFFIDVLHAFNEETNSTCSEMPSVTFRSGSMPMLVTFNNPAGEKKEFCEEGFRITFTPLITGELLVLLYPHESELNKPDPPYTTMAMIKEPGELTMEMANNFIKNGIEAAYYSSFTGIAETRRDDDENPPAPPQRNLIGFKRYETTEKTK